MLYRKTELRKDRQLHKMIESQRILNEAATTIVDAAKEVTIALRTKLDDSQKKCETTAKVITDSLIICEMDGNIQACNLTATKTFGDCIGKNIRDLFVSHIDLTDIWKVLTDKSIFSNVHKAPIKAIKADQTLFSFEPKIETIHWSDNTDAIFVIIKDITSLITDHCPNKDKFSCLDNEFCDCGVKSSPEVDL